MNANETGTKVLEEGEKKRLLEKEEQDDKDGNQKYTVLGRGPGNVNTRRRIVKL